MADKLRIGLIGAGFIVKFAHMPSLKKLGERVEVPVVFSRRLEVARSFAKDNGIPEYTDSWRDVLRRSDIDAVLIATPNYTHKTIAVEAARAGKHIFLEKPIALSVEDGMEIVREAEKQGVKLFVGHCLRFWPEYVRARELVLRGEVGEPRVARAYRRSTFPKWAPWHKDMNLGGGVFVDMSIHDVDFLRWTLGEVEEVYARGGVLKHRDSNAYDYVHAILRFKGGAVAYVEGSWIMPETHPFSTYLEIAGTGGLLRVDNHETSALRVFRTEGTPEDYTPIVRDAYYLELRAFVDCVLKDGEPPVPGEEARRSLEVVLAAVKSIREGRPIRLPLRGEVL